MGLGRKLLLVVGALAVVTGSSVAAASLHDSSTPKHTKPSAAHDTPVPATSSQAPASPTTTLSSSASFKPSPSPAFKLPTGQPKEVVVIRKDGSVLLDAPISGQAVYDAKTGTLVPQGFGAASWFADGWPMPGQPGPSVIVGHIDSKTGPDVFWNLQAAGVGDKIEVKYSTGFTVTFAVTATERFGKTGLPKGTIWARTSSPVLRLITCDPDTHFSHGHYTGNLAVFADQEVSAA